MYFTAEAINKKISLFKEYVAPNANSENCISEQQRSNSGTIIWPGGFEISVLRMEWMGR